MILESSSSRAAVWKLLGLSCGSWESVLLVCCPPPPREKSCSGDFGSCLRVLNTSVLQGALKMHLCSHMSQGYIVQGAVPAAVHITLILVPVFNFCYIFMALYAEKHCFWNSFYLPPSRKKENISLPRHGSHLAQAMTLRYFSLPVVSKAKPVCPDSDLSLSHGWVVSSAQAVGVVMP